MPKGLKPVQRKLATGEVRTYWYHRATGKRLDNDPRTAAGMLEVASLDKRAEAAQEAQKAASGTIAGLWEIYRASPEWTGLKPRTRSDYQKVRDWLGRGAERALLRKITTAEVIGLRDKAYRAKGRRFANYVVQVLRMLFGWGKLRGHLDTNPAEKVPGIRKPTGAGEANRAWSAAEVQAFVSAAPRQLQVPFALGLYAGMRQGDALRVTWAGYDGVNLKWIAGKNGQHGIMAVGPSLKSILDEAKEARGSTLQIATTSTGTAWTQNGFRASFFKLVRKLVDEGHMQPGCTFHGLRHTLGAAARDAGESESRVAAAIGDRSPAMAQIYGRDADRRGAQIAILDAHQKRFANIDWKTRTENASKTAPKSGAKTGKKC